uniref:Uncharacterized protein n=1 Tax=Arundo donax TaxID=35708 RepID=A0A0A9HKK9_ARUDO
MAGAKFSIATTGGSCTTSFSIGADVAGNAGVSSACTVLLRTRRPPLPLGVGADALPPPPSSTAAGSAVAAEAAAGLMSSSSEASPPPAPSPRLNAGRQMCRATS